MAQASAVANFDDTDEETKERIKAQASVMENMGSTCSKYIRRFFWNSPCAGTLKSLGYDAPAAKIAVASLVIAVISLLMGIVYNIWFDRQLNKNIRKQVTINNGNIFNYLLNFLYCCWSSIFLCRI